MVMRIMRMSTFGVLVLGHAHDAADLRVRLSEGPELAKHAVRVDAREQEHAKDWCWASVLGAVVCVCVWCVALPMM
jgi:hypothetical protein